MTLKDLNQESDKESLKKHTDEIGLNEKHLSLIYDTLSDVIFLLAVEPDDCFRFVSVNLAFLAIGGLSREQVVGKRIEQVLPETVHALVISKYNEAINDNKTVFFEQASTLPSGEHVGVVTVTPVCNAEGVCTHLVGTVHDLTERKQAEEALRIANKNTRTILEKAPFGVVVIGRDRKIKWVNDTTLKMAEMENADIMLGKNCGEYLCPAQQNECPILDKGQQVDNSERIFRMKDGKDIPIIKSVTEINIDGEDVLLETFVDNTERKAAEKELKKTTELLQSVMDNATDEAIITTDQMGIILIWNEGAERLLGYEPEEVVGRESIRIFHTEEYLKSGIMDVNVKNMIATGKPLTEELDYVTKDGKTIPVQEIVSPRFDDDGNFKGMVGMARDITKRKQAEEEIKKLNEELEQRVKDRTAELEKKNADLEIMITGFVGRELRMAELKKQIAKLEMNAESDKNSGSEMK